MPDHGVALEAAIALTADRGPLSSIDDVAAIGFKLFMVASSGAVRVDDSVLKQWMKWLMLLQRTILHTSKQ